MTMVFPALDRLLEMAELVRLMGVYELYAAAVALDQRGEAPGQGVETARRLVREVVAPYRGDRPYGPDIETLAAALRDDGRFVALAAAEPD